MRQPLKFNPVIIVLPGDHQGETLLVSCTLRNRCLVILGIGARELSCHQESSGARGGVAGPCDYYYQGAGQIPNMTCRQ
jgi:hypothetical protein